MIDSVVPLYLLQWGLVNTSSQTVASPTQMLVGDTVAIMIYDVSTLVGGPGDVSPANTAPQLGPNWFTIRPATSSTPSTATLFSNQADLQTAVLAPDGGSAGGAQTSAYFGGLTPGGQARTYSFWQVVTNSVPPQPLMLIVQNPNGTAGPAAFFLSWVITINAPAAGGSPAVSKLFGNDPEMIVQP
jgi:hypothetical protein